MLCRILLVLTQVLYRWNLDACAPPAPAPLLLRPTQARLNFGPGPAHLAGRTVAEPRTHPTTNCQLLTRGPKQGQGSRKCDHCNIHILSVSLPVNSYPPCVHLPNTACPVRLACQSSYSLFSSPCASVAQPPSPHTRLSCRATASSQTHGMSDRG
jgi:hypothetical protein